MASDIYNTGKANVDSAANSGSSAINSFDPSGWAASTQNGLTNLWGNQNKTQNDYIQAFKDTIASNPSVTDLYGKANEIFNVPQLQQTANTLNNAVLKAPISNVEAAKGFNVDQNQVDQKTAQDLYYLSPQANAAQANANTAEGNASNFVQAGIAQNNFNLLPIQEQGQYLMDAYARQQSGFTTTAQAQLQALQAKMEAGERLSEAEMSAYTQLASSESAYQQAIIGQQTSLGVERLKNQYIPLTAGQTLVNTLASNPAQATYRAT